MNYVIKYRDYWRQGWTCFQGGRSTSSPEPLPDGEKRFARHCHFGGADQLRQLQESAVTILSEEIAMSRCIGVDGYWPDEDSQMSSVIAIKRSADLLTELEAEGDDA